MAANIEEDQTSTPEILSGWLKKQGEKIPRTWKKRFFKQDSFKPSRLHYYNPQASTSSLGFIDLASILNVVQVSEIQFDLITSERVYHLQVFRDPSNGIDKSERELVEFWTNGINKWIQHYHHQRLKDRLRTKQRTHSSASFKESRSNQKGLIANDEMHKRADSDSEDLHPSTTKNLLGSIIQDYNSESEQLANTNTPAPTAPTRATSDSKLLGSRPQNQESPEKTSLDKQQSQQQLLARKSLPAVLESANSAPAILVTPPPPENNTNKEPHSQKDPHNNTEPSSMPEETQKQTPAEEPAHVELPKEGTTQSEPKHEPTEKSKEFLTPSMDKTSTNEPFGTEVHVHAPIHLISATSKTRGIALNPKRKNADSELPLSTAIAELPVEPKEEPVQPQQPQLGLFVGCFVVVCLLFGWLPVSFILGLLSGIALLVIAACVVVVFFVADDGKPVSQPVVVDLSRLEKVDSAKDFSNPPIAAVYGTKVPCEWFNMLFSKVFREHVECEGLKRKYINKLNYKIQQSKKPGFINSIKIEDIDFGDYSIRILDGVTLRPPQEEGELRAAFDMKYGGTVPVKVTVVTEVYINWPTEHFAKVAATFTLIIEHISGPCIFVMPPGKDPLCTLAFTDEPVTHFNVETVVGHKVQFKNVPKVSNFLVKKLQKYICIEMKEPNGVCFHIPIKGERQLKILLLTRWRTRNSQRLEKDKLRELDRERAEKEKEKAKLNLTKSDSRVNLRTNVN